MDNKIIAIVGATGLVGQTVLQVLEEKNLTDFKYELLASKRSQGKKIRFMNKEYEVEELTPKYLAQCAACCGDEHDGAGVL